ncbi:NAD(P)-binding domain-containing protein [Streptomyces sp. B6B3]|uniref:NADPH-dependent F420 reductase n=1 Tax=Streptomyces sp. B6B3 TaxID=3153570 RepID=UPI00325E8148
MHGASIARPARTDRCVSTSLPWLTTRSAGDARRETAMRIGILGTGALAAALGEGWVRAGHAVVIGGRSPARAERLADRLGGGARAVPPREAVVGRDAVLLAVPWDAAEDMLRLAGASDGSLAGTPLIDPTNAVAHGVGVLLTEDGEPMARRIAGLAPGAHVVKAFHLFPAAQWTGTGAGPGTANVSLVTVAMCGDEPAALDVVSELVRDVGGTPAVLGALDRVRQLEEVAGFVIGLVFAGCDPGSAVPRAASSATRPGGPGEPRAAR